MVLGIDIDTAQVLSPVLDAVGEATERDLTWRTPTELAGVLDSAPRLQSMVDAMVALAVVHADRAGVQKAHEYEYRTITQMVADRTGADPAKVRRLGRLGTWVEEFDLFTSAWQAGDLLTEHVDVIRRVADNPRTHTALLGDQDKFITWAAEFDFTDFAHVLQYWMLANDPDGAEPKDQTDKTYFRSRKRHDGTVKLDGLLDPLTGAAFMTAFERETQKLFRAAADSQDDTTSDNGSSSPGKSDLDRPSLGKPDLGKRGADALMNLVVRGSARADGSRVEPLINIVMSEGVAEDIINRIAEPSDDPLPLAFDDIDKRCELIDGTPIHPDYVLQVMGIATFRRQIMTAAGRAIDVSVNARCFTDWQKNALRIEARGRCRDRGCDAPFSWLEADHHHPHSRGGPTRLNNGKMRCGPDNKVKGDRLPENPAA